jgi:hypothetical protein
LPITRRRLGSSPMAFRVARFPCIWPAPFLSSQDLLIRLRGIQ